MKNHRRTKHKSKLEDDDDNVIGAASFPDSMSPAPRDQISRKGEAPHSEIITYIYIYI